MRLLITSGATREPIDGVRFISNFSTGRTGARLADFFVELGFEVTYLRGEGAAEPLSRCEILEFSSFQDLDDSLRRELARGRYFAVIHMAAVSDYSVREIRAGGRSLSPGEVRKLDSSQEEMSLVLKRNFKIVDRLKSYAGAENKPLVLAFKLTNGDTREAALQAAARVALSGEVDGVVHNDLAQMKGTGAHRFEFFRVEFFRVEFFRVEFFRVEFFRASGGKLGRSTVCEGASELGTALVQWFGEKIEETRR